VTTTHDNKPATDEVVPGLWSIPVPIPDNPLGYTLVYLFETRRGPVLVDAGWDDDSSWDALVAGCSAAGTSIADCYGVLVTHVHPDHHGLSGRVREASGAWIALHERDAAMVTRMSSATGGRTTEAKDFRDELAAVLLDGGASEHELVVAAEPRRHGRRRRQAPLVSPDRFVEDGASMDVPGWNVQAVWTPGHSPGHTCFRVPAHGLLLAGDHVLPTITPHIAISRADRHGDPLSDFLASLEKVDRPDVDLVLPAHEHRFAPLHRRVVEITAHHHDHLAAIEAVLASGPATLWDIARSLAWNRPWAELTLSMKRAAVNETAAHLRYLSRRQRAVRFKSVRPLTFGLPENGALEWNPKTAEG
jgi:glyoxylase-like metal-dependent hydrolase (beta-lactamase superfamily II)